MMICRTVIFRGTVQGVGFRWTTMRLAGSYAVSGTVRNCDDGSVELVAEGDADEVSAFVAAVSGRLGSYIDEASSADAPASGRFTGFRITD
jgi:acylphosphatase